MVEGWSPPERCVSSDNAKRALRAKMRAVIAGLSAAQQQDGSGRACAHLAALEHWKRARTVMLFWPMAGEPSAEHAARLFRGTVCLPRVDWVAGVMVPAAIPGWGLGLMPPERGVRAPGPECPQVDPRTLDLVVVPGLSFDRLGGRLGRGAGFYDRFLAGLRAVRVGLCFDEQIVDQVPTDPGDERMHCVVSPSGVIDVT
ncbi:MAG: 5-formyltetrahydrofolate cyclo-ligase [Leptolyngbya sp. PLA1]|nr:5-formyltetrahydrofolate cyclo-ligase [Leptolyngbya sp. PLA1]